MGDPSLAARRSMILDELGIDTWRLRVAADPATQPSAVTEPTTDGPAELQPVLEVAPDSGGVAAAGEPTPAPLPALNDWSALNQRIRACTLCSLHETRTQAVCGVGSEVADWLVVGEAPGAEEDARGEPFVGRAGQLLDQMLLAVGRSRQTVYIANVLKCRPPNNRNPTPEEVAQCRPHLDQQIELLQPRLILAVGAIAARALLGMDPATPVGKLRGTVHRYGPEAIPLVVTYHPAYLLRRPVEKRRSWDDLLLAQAQSSDAPGIGGGA